MEKIGLKFSSGHMLVLLDPVTKKVNITATIKDTALSGNVTLKPAKTAKETK